MSAEEAGEHVAAFGRGAGELDICSVEGRTKLRAAVQTHAKAQEAVGKEWPNLNAFMEGEGEAGVGDVAVFGAVMAGIIKPNDLRGQARGVAGLMNLGLSMSTEGRMFKEGLTAACDDVWDLMQLEASTKMDAARGKKSIERAMARGDDERVMQLEERLAKRLQRTQTQRERLMARIGEKIEAAEKN